MQNEKRLELAPGGPSRREGAEMNITFDEQLKPVVTDQPKEIALEQRGLLGGIDRFSIGDVKVGHALLGGATATVISEIISGVAPGLGGGAISGNIVAGVLKIGAAGLFGRALSGVVGKQSADAAMLFLAYDAMRDIIPIDVWINQLLGRAGMAASQGSPYVPVNPSNINVGNGAATEVSAWLSSKGA